MNRKAIYPGTFDPVTYGHLDIIKRASGLYDRVIVAIAHSDEKDPFFSVDERVGLLQEATENMENVFVESFKGLVVDFAKANSSKVVLRGIRMISDFDYEFQMALTNRKLAPEIETVFMMPNEKYSYLSSKLIKEVASLGADISSFVPTKVEKRLKERFER